MKESAARTKFGRLVFVLGIAGSLIGGIGATKAASLTVIYPRGGECFTPYAEIVVQWLGKDFDHVAIGYRVNETRPISWDQKPYDWDLHPVSGQSATWKVPNIITKTTFVWVEAHDINHARVTLDANDVPFSIASDCPETTPPPPATAPETPPPAAPPSEPPAPLPPPSPSPSAEGPETLLVVESTPVSPVEEPTVQAGEAPLIVGAAQPNETVKVTVAPISEEATVSPQTFTAVADADGNWSLKITTDKLAVGEYRVLVELPGKPAYPVHAFTVTTEKPKAAESRILSWHTPLVWGIIVVLLLFPLLLKMYLAGRRRLARQ